MNSIQKCGWLVVSRKNDCYVLNEVLTLGKLTNVCIAKDIIFPVVMYGCESWTRKKAECWRIDAFELWCWRRLWESLGLQGDPTSASWRKSNLNIHWKDWNWSWNPNALATWCKDRIHWKRPWWWKRLRAGGEGDDRGWDGWMASLTRCHQFE